MSASAPFRIVDTQVHIWAANTPDRPWAKGMEQRAHRPVPLAGDDVLRMMEEARVDHAILIPPSLDGDRNDLCLNTARAHPDRFAVMGRILLDQPYAPARLEAMAQEEAMLGVRLTFHRDDDRPLLTNGKADWFWPMAERLGVPVMVHAPERLKEIGEIARHHPHLKIIIDHMGFARETVDDAAEAAATRLLALASHDNIAVKVSAAPCYSTHAYPFRNLHASIERIITGFGIRRAFWGSDLSRLLEHCSYRQAVTMFTEELEFLSDSDLEWVMGRGVLEWLDWRPAT